MQQGNAGAVATRAQASRGEMPVPYRPFLSRIQKHFRSRPDAHLASIEDGFRDGRLRPPVQPMTDQELARAIREFQSAPVSDWTLHKLSNHFENK
jgi:hypothetical protein